MLKRIIYQLRSKSVLKLILRVPRVIKKPIQKIISKNILKFLIIYKDFLEDEEFEMRSIYENEIWYQVRDLIRLIKRNYDKDKKWKID